MEDNRIHIDDLYREELGSYTEAPGAAVWQKLQDRLDKEQKPKGSTWTKWFGRGTAILLLLVAIFFVANSDIINHHQNQPEYNEPIAVNNTHAAPVNPSATGAAVTTPESETAPVNPTPTTVSAATQQATEALKPKATDAQSQSSEAIAHAAPVVNHTTATAAKPTPAKLSDAVTSVVKEETTKQLTEKKINTPAASSTPSIAKKETAPTPAKLSDAVTSVVKEETTKQLTEKKNNTPAASSAPSVAKNEATPVPDAKPAAAKLSNAMTSIVKEEMSKQLTDKKNNTPAASSAPSAAKKETMPAPPAASTPTVAKKENAAPIPAAEPPVAQKPAEKPKAKAEPAADVSAAIGKMKDTTNNPAVASVPPKPEHWKEYRPFRLDLDFGLKAGYEWGFGSYHANSYVISPYLQYKINDKLSVIFQPGYKAAKLNSTDLNDHKSYYQISDSRLDSSQVLTIMGINPNTQLSIFGIARKYNYSQSHDSIIISKAIKSKTFYEIELPLLLQYQVMKTLGIYAGASANFSKVAQIEETRVVYSGITLKDSLLFAAENIPSEPPAIPSIYEKFNYAATPYNQYTPVSSLNATTNPVRFNFMVGVNYNVWKRITVDVLLQGNLSSLSYIPDDRIKQIYKTPHLRVLIGYRLGK
ncbi:MAG: hypothetical protein JST82_00965 [Bacteroidetes bacterium]|nr:hypothetical protein [Bacteroidota bacterium]